ISIVVADAQSDSDLSCLVQACDQSERLFVLCGSSGLAASLVSGRSASAEPPATVERVLVVVGSLHRVAQAQARMLSRRARWPLLSLSPRAALDAGEEWAAWCASMRAVLAQDMTQASGVVLVADPEVLTDLGLTPRAIAESISQRIAEVAATAVELMDA